MNRKPIYCLLAVLIAAQLACSLFTAQPAVTPTAQDSAPSPVTPSAPVETSSPAETPTLDVAAPTETPFSSRISLEMLKNFTYGVPDFNLQTSLQEGVFSGDQVQINLIEPAAFGDLNGDGQPDAAVVLTVDPGGSGTFYYLITLLDQDGTPVQSGFSSIGDRQVVKDLRIAGGRIILDYLTQGLSGPLCCPSEHRLRSYLLENGALRLASEQVLDGPEVQATALPNAILIDQPPDADQLTSPQQVSGRVSQVPPEKKLAYYVTDMTASLLSQGEVPVEGEPGGPGAFAFEFDLGAIPPGLVQVEVVDAAGGSLRGRSTVVLVAP